MKTETVKLAKGERIDVVKESVGYSITGPAIVVVLKEEAAAETTAHLYGDSDSGLIERRKLISNCQYRE